MEKCSELDSDFVTIEAGNLSDFGVQIRYPDEMYMSTDKEVLAHKEIAMGIRNLVKLKLGI